MQDSNCTIVTSAGPSPRAWYHHLMGKAQQQPRQSTRTSTRVVAASLDGAERACRAQGLRLTEKRRRLLAALLRASAPISAYELAQAYREENDDELPVMTVYRMLDVFMEAGIVHKLRSTNRFMACRHMACDHPHAQTQFLICDGCGLVREMDFADKEISQLDRKARSSGFYLFPDQLELHGLCDSCHGAGPGASLALTRRQADSQR